MDSINEIYASNNWSPEPYNYGMHPFAFVQRQVIMIAHGAEPVIHPKGYTVKNIYPIGTLKLVFWVSHFM